MTKEVGCGLRIRSIKPEFWSSPDLPADPWARLLFIAMWNWADDQGVGTANPRELLGFAFPNDDHLSVVDLRRMLVEIHRVFDVKFYTVAGRPYYAIPSWESHQKFDRRSKGKHPGPDEAETWLYQDECEESVEARGIPTSARRDSVAGTGEQGNRGTGEQIHTRKRASVPIPDNWAPNDKHTAKATAKGIDVDILADEMRNWAQSKDERKVDWDAAFNNWINRSERKPGNALRVGGRAFEE